MRSLVETASRKAGRTMANHEHRSPLLLLGTATMIMICQACIAIPHPRNIAMAKGKETRKPNLAAFNANATTRKALTDLVGRFDTDASAGPFFWARWQQVKVQVEWAAASPGAGSGGSERVWKIINVLAIFDENGGATERRICSERELIGCISAMVRKRPEAFAPPESLLVPAEHQRYRRFREGRAIVEKGKLSFEGRANRNFTTSLKSVTGLTLHTGSSPEFLRVKVHVSGTSKPAGDLMLTLSPREACQLIGALREAGAPVMNE